MRVALCNLYNTTSKLKLNKSSPCDLLSLPLPSEAASEALQLLISTYLLHAIIYTTHSPCDASFISTALHTTPTLLQWLPHLPSLPQVHKHSIITRAYTVLTNFSSSFTSVSPRAIFSIRTYSLHCLLHTTPASLDPTTFWDQATKFCVSYVKACMTHPHGEEVEEAIVLGTFVDLVQLATDREDYESWTNGRGFVNFCEYWMGFAKRVSPLVFVLLFVSSIQWAHSHRRAI
jgi:separase